MKVKALSNTYLAAGKKLYGLNIYSRDKQKKTYSMRRKLAPVISTSATGISGGMSSIIVERVFFPEAPAEKKAITDKKKVEQPHHQVKVTNKKSSIVRLPYKKLSKPVAPPTELYSDYVKLSPPKLLRRFKSHVTKTLVIDRPIPRYAKVLPRDEAQAPASIRLKYAIRQFENLCTAGKPMVTAEDAEVAAICANLKYTYNYDL